MGKLACGLLALILATGSALAAPWWAPSPLSIVLTVGSWMMKDRVEVFYVRVQAHGRDETDAREQAFRLAVNQAVGSLLLSHTEVRDGEVVRRDIINYSSGHIHDFQILNREHRDGGILIQADVWVRKSQIADRLLSESRAAGRVEGGRISEQINSFRNQKAQADRVIQAVLDDFPHRSFDVTVGNTQVAVDGRNTYLHVPVVLSWNSSYLAAMAEALRTVNPRPDCGGWFSTCQSPFTVRIGRQRADFDDDTAMFELFDRGISQKQAVALLKLKGVLNDTVFEACYGIEEMNNGTWSSWKFAGVDGYGVRFQEGVVRTTLVLDTQALDLKGVDRAEVSIIPVRQCPRYPGRR